MNPGFNQQPSTGISGGESSGSGLDHASQEITQDHSQHRMLNELAIAMSFLEYVSTAVKLDEELNQERKDALERLTRVANWIKQLDMGPG